MGDNVRSRGSQRLDDAKLSGIAVAIYVEALIRNIRSRMARRRWS